MSPFRKSAKPDLPRWQRAMSWIEMTLEQDIAQYKKLERERDHALERRDMAYQLAQIRLYAWEQTKRERDRLQGELERVRAENALLREACQKVEIAEHKHCTVPGCGLCKLNALCVAGDIGRMK